MFQRIRIFGQAPAGPDAVDLDQNLTDNLGIEQKIGMLDLESPEVEKQGEKGQDGMDEPGPFLELGAGACAITENRSFTSATVRPSGATTDSPAGSTDSPCSGLEP